MDILSIELIRELCNNNSILWTTHVVKRLEERNIYREDVINAINNGYIIEQYPDSYPNPACLVLGITLFGETIHVVVGYSESYIVIITAYFPDTEKFENDLKTRRK